MWCSSHVNRDRNKQNKVKYNTQLTSAKLSLSILVLPFDPFKKSVNTAAASDSFTPFVSSFVRLLTGLRLFSFLMRRWLALHGGIAVRRIRCTPLSVVMISLIWPTCRCDCWQKTIHTLLNKTSSAKKATLHVQTCRLDVAFWNGAIISAGYKRIFTSYCEQ